MWKWKSNKPLPPQLGVWSPCFVAAMETLTKTENKAVKGTVHRGIFHTSRVYTTSERKIISNQKTKVRAL